MLGPTLFLLYINDLDEGICSWILKFADDTKIFGTFRNFEDNGVLQADLDRLVQWATEWQMEFNVQKCKVMHYGKKNVEYNYVMKGQVLQKVAEHRDLGAELRKDLKVSNQCAKAYARASKAMGFINRTIVYKSVDVMLQLCKSLVRPH